MLDRTSLDFSALLDALAELRDHEVLVMISGRHSDGSVSTAHMHGKLGELDMASEGIEPTEGVRGIAALAIGDQGKLFLRASEFEEAAENDLGLKILTSELEIEVRPFEPFSLE